MDARELLEKHREEIEALCRRYDVASLRLFGSGAKGMWSAASSDLDFLVEYGPESRHLSPLERLVGLQMDLETLLGRKVDVVDWQAARNPYYRESALASAEQVYAA
jgi:predicted nucleotidyltransferase